MSQLADGWARGFENVVFLYPRAFKTTFSKNFQKTSRGPERWPKQPCGQAHWGSPLYFLYASLAVMALLDSPAHGDEVRRVEECKKIAKDVIKCVKAAPDAPQHLTIDDPGVLAAGISMALDGLPPLNEVNAVPMLRRFSATWVLADVLWHCVECVERAGQYRIANGTCC